MLKSNRECESMAVLRESDKPIRELETKVKTNMKKTVQFTVKSNNQYKFNKWHQIYTLSKSQLVYLKFI